VFAQHLHASLYDKSLTILRIFDVNMEAFDEIDAKCKRRKPGIVYLSRIPRRMNVKQIRHRFGSYGEVGRVFLKPVGKIRFRTLTGQFTNKPTRGQSSRGLDNSRTSQLADSEFKKIMGLLSFVKVTFATGT